MKIHYFFHRGYAPQSGIILAAYQKKKLHGQIFYERLEYLTLFIPQKINLVVSFYHEFVKGNNDVLWRRNQEELLYDIAKDQLKTIEAHNYIRFRKAAIGMYKNTEILDFETFKTKNN